MKVFVFGAGKVGRALAKAMSKKGIEVTLRPARKGLPRTKIDASIVILSVREKTLATVCAELVQRKLLSKNAICVHNAGSLPADAIASLRKSCAGVAQMHPMISFASTSFFPTLGKGHVHVKGDRAAEAKATSLAKRIGMTPRRFERLDTVGYHAAAGLVANGAAALAALGAELLVVAGVPRKEAPKMLGPLLRSVAENVEALGFPDALTGPVRRGDAGAIEKQISLLADRLPSVLPLFLASTVAQIPLARALGDSPPANFDAIERVVRAHVQARASARASTNGRS